ncbi:MAG: DUF2341 domain-containing protein, partial [Acidimicrobiia bacterium]
IQVDRDNHFIYNNVVYNLTGATGGLGIWNDVLGDNVAYDNNTVYNCRVGFQFDDAATDGLARNNISVGNTIDYNGFFHASSSNNLDSDATAPGASPLTDTAANLFVSLAAGAEDLHLKGGAAIDSGVDLSSVFVIDIDAQLRPKGVQWDRGADERPLTGSCPVAQQAWFDQDWLFRKAVVIHSTQVTAVLTGFPVLINLASDTELAADAQDDGDDIVFTASDGVTKLSHEIEKFCGGIITPSCPADTGELVAWVKVPYLSSGADTTIYMYYGNGTVGNQQDVANVWDANFKGVWHLEEELAGTGNLNLYTDSTAPAYDGDDFVSATGQNGQINDGQEFDATDDYIDTGADDPLDLIGPLSVSAWVFRRSNAAFHHIASKNGAPAGGTPWQFAMAQATNALRHFAAVDEFTWETIDSVDPVSLGAWHHVVMVRNAGQVTFYIDGAQDSGGWQALSVAPTANVVTAKIGSHADTAQNFFDGFLDDVRISDTPRSPEWIQTEYNNQKPLASFYTVCSATTEVELASFEAKGLDEAVELRWETASELDNLGFHLYRSSSEEGSYERITETAIPGLGSSPVGAKYDYRDTGLTNGVTYYYKLEDIETTGVTELHGPVSATP